MSKSTVSKKKERRKIEKHQRKEAKKKEYQRYAELGKNGKSARSRRKQRAGSGKRLNCHKVHRIPCGNVACTKCYKEFHEKLAKKGD